jgi:hypothetical protein
MYARCYDQFGDGAGFVLIGANDGISYLYVMQPAVTVAAIAKPIAGTATDGGVGQYEADVYATVGASNQPFHSGSYTIMHIKGNADTKKFEMAVAGLAVQFCGAQVRSDGANVYGEGSADAGPDACGEPATLCVSATALTTPSTCSPALMTFGLTRLGRAATTDGSFTAPASKYPSTPNVTLDGSATDALHVFGPVEPPAGVGRYTVNHAPMGDAGRGHD